MLKINSSLFKIILISLLIPVIPFLIIGELPGQKWLSSNDSNAFAFALSGTVLLASDIVLPIPSSIIGTMLGARLGAFPGFVWCWIGLEMGNIIGYFVGRFADKFVSEKTDQSPTLLILAMSRPIPIISEAITFLAGATGTKFFPFLFISSFANAVYAAVLTSNAAYLFPENSTYTGLLIPILIPVASWAIWKYKIKDHF